MRFSISSTAWLVPPQQALEALAKRLDTWREHAGLQIAQQLEHREKRVRFGSVEPESGQLVARRIGCQCRKAIAVALAVPDDGRMKAAAHVLDVALERGERNLQLVQEASDGHALMRPNQAVDAVEAFGAIHFFHPPTPE